MPKKVIKIQFTSNGHSCAVEQDATGYVWYYLGNTERPLESSCVPAWLRADGGIQLAEASKIATTKGK